LGGKVIARLVVSWRECSPGAALLLFGPGRLDGSDAHLTQSAPDL